jgi:multiple sugar transport system permease protein
MIAGFGSVLLASLIGIPAAYALARFEMKRKEDIAFFILTARMGPAIGFMIPFFLMWKTLGMLDNIFALILTYLTFNIPITLWMMRGFFQAIPRDIEEAAMVDGCTRFQVFFKIVLPLVRTGMLATFTLCLIFSLDRISICSGINIYIVCYASCVSYAIYNSSRHTMGTDDGGCCAN